MKRHWNQFSTTDDKEKFESNDVKYKKNLKKKDSCKESDMIIDLHSYKQKNLADNHSTSDKVCQNLLENFHIKEKKKR